MERILKRHGQFYIVYPSWAQLTFTWNEVTQVFSDPYSSGHLRKEENLDRMGYTNGLSKYKLISGPVGNGIIAGEGYLPTARYFWIAVLIREVNFSAISEFFRYANIDVYWANPLFTADHQLGLKRVAPVFIPKMTLEYADLPDKRIFVSLAFRASKSGVIDSEVCARFAMRCEFFGWSCRAVDSKSEEMPLEARLLDAPTLNHRWYVIDPAADDMGLVVAKAFYLAGAAKRENSRLFQFMHLVGSFEGKPAMAKQWRSPKGEIVFPNLG